MSRSRAVFEAERLYTVTSKPALMQLAAMEPPIMPIPMNPTRGLFIDPLLSFRRAGQGL